MKQKEVWIIQSDLTLLLNTNAEYADEARKHLVIFAELMKVISHYECYEITAVSLWNAMSSGLKMDKMLHILKNYARGNMPVAVEVKICEWGERFGKLLLKEDHNQLLLTGDEKLLQEIMHFPSIQQWVVESTPKFCEFVPHCRGFLKQELAHLGYPLIDEVGYHEGEQVHFFLGESTKTGQPFQLRDYQRKAIACFMRDRIGGSGVIVLPCGTGKTITGIGVMASLQTATLILASSTTSANQWRKEILDKTTLKADDVAIYGGKERNVSKITIATYTILTHRNQRNDQYEHMKIFSKRDWGLIIYDEVQLLPAPIFRMTAELQATRRLGLTATLVREDGCAKDVFSLVGPKLYDMQWKRAEQEQYIAKVNCTEIRVEISDVAREEYERADARTKLKLAAMNPQKLKVVQHLLQLHRGMPTLIIGQYIQQLEYIARKLNLPLLTGKQSQKERDELYEQFKRGDVSTIVVSKIANLAVDLPDAAVAIQISGSFGSRQEEAQRIGRLLRPKQQRNEAWFYTVVSDHTKETQFSLKRGMFMLEQGYDYTCLHESEVALSALAALEK